MKNLVFIGILVFSIVSTACEDSKDAEKKNQEPSVCDCVEKANEDAALADECEKMFENASEERQQEILEEVKQCN